MLIQNIQIKRCLLIIPLLLLSCIITSAQDTTSSPPKETKAISFAGLPTLNYDRSKGFGIGAMGMMFFRLSDNPATPKSRLAIMGNYSTKGSWNASSFLQLYMLNDMLRLATGGGYADINFQTFFSIPGMDEIVIPYENNTAFFFLNPSVKIYDHLYAGASILILSEKVDFEAPDSSIHRVYDLNGLGITLNYDARNNVYNPTKGIFSGIRYNIYPNWMNNDSAFSKLMFNANYYYAFDPTKILASRIAVKVGFGNVPFVGQNYVGNQDIRGYTKGEYRGEQVYAVQSEFRWRFYKRLGMVGFAGLALAVSEADGTSPLLPGAGIGVRYMVLPKDQINVGFDAAIGRNDWGIYFRITEAF